MKLKKYAVVLCLVLLPGMSQISRADLVYQLEVFTDNGSFAQDSSIDLYFQVVSGESGVDFTFYNDSTVDSAVAKIYFEDSGLLTFSGITNSTGTKFTADSMPGNLPGGHSLAPSFDAEFSFSAKAPPPKNGINPAEFVTFSFDFTTGVTSTDIVSALNNRNMRIGAHVIGLPDGSSESVINVPLPSTVLLLSFGMFILRNKKLKIA